MKYLGLLGLPGILAANGKLESEHKDTILKCLGDDDVTIRLRALELLDGLVCASTRILAVNCRGRGGLFLSLPPLSL